MDSPGTPESKGDRRLRWSAWVWSPPPESTGDPILTGSKRGALDPIADLASKELFPLEDWEREYHAKVSDPTALLAVLVDMIGTF